MPRSDADGIRGGSETILLADDEQMIRRLGRTILQRQGYRVLLAEDGAEAVEIYKQRAERDRPGDPRPDDAAAVRPGALLELRKINPEVGVLISSGYSSDEDLRTVERAGVVGFVAKPYRPADLVRRVRAAIDEVKKVGPSSVS